MDRFVTMTRKEQITGVCWLFCELFLLAPVLRLLLSALGAGEAPAALNLASIAVNTVVTVFLLRRFLKNELRRCTEALPRRLLLLGAGLAVYCALALAAAALFPGEPENNRILAELLRQCPVPMSIGLILLSPLAEECLFRGVVFGILGRRSPFLAYGISILLFLGIHCLQLSYSDPAALLSAAANYLPGALVFTVLYGLSGSLIPSVAAHSIVNAAACVRILFF